MKRVILALAIVLGISSCARDRQQFSRGLQNSDRQYTIDQYSGGKLIYHDTFYGIISQEEHSDGFYYFKGDTLIEVGGDYVIKSK